MSVNELTSMLIGSMTIESMPTVQEYCCATFDYAITLECRHCVAKYFSTLLQSKESVIEGMMRIISEKKTTLFELVCNNFFGDLLPDPEIVPYENIYKSLTEEDNKVFSYINTVTQFIIDDQNAELMQILQSYLASWLDEFGGGKRDEYYEKCIDIFYDFFDTYINKLCNTLVDECNTTLLSAVLRSYNEAIYEIDINELIINSIIDDKYDSFRFLYNYYITEICECSINIHTLSSIYRVIFIHDRINMFRLLYKLTKYHITKSNILKLLDKYNDGQECSKLFKSNGIKAHTLPKRQSLYVNMEN